MKFGVREICDVTFKATDNRTIGNTEFKKGQPVFMIDTAKTSTLEQATTTVYAQGGKGNSRLIAWEGEKTMTFTVEDALMSPMGLAVLSGAGLIDAKDKEQHVHVTYDVEIEDNNGTATIELAQLIEELGLPASTETINICDTIDVYGTKLDGSGAGIDWYSEVSIVNKTVTKSNPASFAVGKATTDLAKAGEIVKLDFYVILTSGVQEVSIAPEDFGGYFYVEADTLYRREDTGKDMAAVITLPKVKVQSAFTFTMASSGDPSTFTFTMDAFPGYTYFDRTKKVMCVMQIVGTDGTSTEEVVHRPHTED